MNKDENVRFSDIKTNEGYTKLFLENKDVDSDIINKFNSVGLYAYLEDKSNEE